MRRVDPVNESRLLDATAALTSSDVMSTAAASHRLAWSVLLLSFAAFCFLCLLSGIGMYAFLFESTVPIDAQVLTGRGTLVITEANRIEQAIPRGRDLEGNAIVSTYGQSQGTLSFYDDSNGRTLIAALTLGSESRVDLQRATRARFDWSNQAYLLTIENMQGVIDVYVPPTLSRALILMLRSQAGVVYLTQSGRYQISASEERLTLSTLEGEALITAPDRQSQTVSLQQRVTYDVAAGTFEPLPVEQVLSLGGFRDGNVVELSDAASLVAEQQAWRCTNRQNDYPAGQYLFGQLDGRSSLRLYRGGGANSHGDTSCYQTLGAAQAGLAVRDYTYLALRASFRIHQHSLTTCGTEGSECPMMLRMDYISETGEALIWRHGFYAFSDPQTAYPVRCDTCAQDHDAVNNGVWMQYDSGNLMTAMPAGERPQAIINLQFYASGHEYDVDVERVALVGMPGIASP